MRSRIPIDGGRRPLLGRHPRFFVVKQRRGCSAPRRCSRCKWYGSSGSLEDSDKAVGELPQRGLVPNFAGLHGVVVGTRARGATECSEGPLLDGAERPTAQVMTLAAPLAVTVQGTTGGACGRRSPPPLSSRSRSVTGRVRS
jgi:hypothetical protein